MKRLLFLLVAILGNGLGSALMLESNIGMSAWGSAAANLALYYDITPGIAFVYISLVFYLIAIGLNKTCSIFEIGLSMLFLVSFSAVLDGCLYLIPNLTSLALGYRIGINLIGILVLLFSIALHLHINIAVHPMDVFLQAMQRKFRNVTLGTYLAYLCAFSVAILFGLLNDGIQHIGIGTGLLLTLGGWIMGVYNKVFFSHKKEGPYVSN